MEESPQMRHAEVLVCLSLAWAGAATPALALDPSAGSANVKVRLVSEVAAIEPAKPFFVVLQLTMAPSWHTYWKNPGDSGRPTQVVWTLPDGFQASELQWPVPERAADAGLAVYAYEGEALFLAEITPGADLPKGRFSLNANVSWLECNDICIPGRAAVALSLPSVSSPRRNAADPSAKALFARARAAQPRKSPLTRAGHAVEGNRLTLKLIDAPPALGSPLEFFPEIPGLVEAREPQSVSRAGTGWAISMKRLANTREPQTLTGVLITRYGTRRIAWEIRSEAARP